MMDLQETTKAHVQKPNPFNLIVSVDAKFHFDRVQDGHEEQEL